MGYFKKLSVGWGPIYIIPVLIGYGIAVWFLRMYYMTMFKVTMTFNKAYALMKISSDPLTFVANANTARGEHVEASTTEDETKDPMVEDEDDREQDVPSLNEIEKVLEHVKVDQYKVTDIVDLLVEDHLLDTLEGLTERDLIEMKIPMGPRKKILKFISEHTVIPLKVALPLEQRTTFLERKAKSLLNDKLTAVNPRFLMAWADLREHIQQWEVGYFFELLQPIVSLEIIFVLSMLGMAVVFLLQEPYSGDIRYFLSDLVVTSNVALILMLFLILVVITLLNHLHALLRPYAVQITHESWLEVMARKMKTEEANIAAMRSRASEPDRDPDSKDNQAMCNYLMVQADALSKTRTLLDQMRTEMSANRSAPKLLGVLVLNETLIETIIASITTAITGFAFAFVSGVMTDIQEGTGFMETTYEPTTTWEPTYAPSWGPTA